MKKIITFLIIVTMLVLSGCKNTQTPENTQKSTEEITGLTSEIVEKSLEFQYAENNFSGDAAKENSKYIKAGFKAVDYYLGAGIHEGVDINTGTRTGINVVAVKSGEIYATRYNEIGSYGVGAYIKNYDNTVYVYGHHKKLYNSKGIGTGFYVLAGKPLGECGDTGRSSGEHLHFEVWTTSVTLTEVSDGLVTWSPNPTRTSPISGYLPGITSADVRA